MEWSCNRVDRLMGAARGKMTVSLGSKIFYQPITAHQSSEDVPGCS
jgi:hypothetical protein